MVCRECGEEVEALVAVKRDSKRTKVCEECADRLREEGEIAEVAQGVMRDMMGYRQRW